jgi:hypothetical protein
MKKRLQTGALVLGTFVFISSFNCLVLGELGSYGSRVLVHESPQNELPKESAAVSLLKALLVDVQRSLTTERMVPEVETSIGLASSATNKNMEELSLHDHKTSDDAALKHNAGPQCTLDTMVSICEHKFCDDGVCAYCRRDADC